MQLKYTPAKFQYMLAIHPGKMQETRYLRDSFSLVVFILGSWLITNIDANSTPSLNPWTNPPPLPPHLAQTRRTLSGVPISYRLDTWSQYENPEEGMKREGDIHELSHSRKTITRDKRLLWPGGVVKYYIDTSIVNEPTKFAMLEDAMNIIMSKTCVKFVRIYPDENGELPTDSWVNITGSQNGCYSDLGRSSFGASRLNLNVKKCFRVIGHPIHEMLHTLGVYHEHMRPDRDEHITIVWENIKPGDVFNFHILNNSIVTDYGLPYDYDSIMHYSMTAFSKDRTFPTIIPKNPHMEIGQRDHLSYYDIQKLLITYNCSDIEQSDKKNEKKYSVPKKNEYKINECQKSSKEMHVPFKVKGKIVITIQKSMESNGLQNSNHIILKKPNENDQMTFVKHKHVQPNYSVPLINFLMYPHIHFHIYNN